MSSSIDEDSEEELEEPQVKYERMGNDLLEILKKDAASCIALHCKFVALGTHWGKIHILDHEGNNNTNKQFSQHESQITGISLDETGEYVASCSSDGVVSVSGLYNDEHNLKLEMDQPVKSIAIEPEYARSSSKQVVIGTDQLILCERSWLRRKQQTVLHRGEGIIGTIRWKGQLIAWSNNWGVKIYDTRQQRRITHISRSMPNKRNDDYRPELYPAHLTWKDDKTILIGWANDIKVCAVKEKITRDFHEPTKYCVILYMFKTDFICCGIAPLGNQIVALAFMEESDDEEKAGDNQHVDQSTRPQLRILEPNLSNKESYIEVSRDALSIRGYQRYRCNDYSMEHDSSELFVVSPKDIVLAQKRDEDDRITWLLQINHHKEALEAVKEYGKRLKKHSYLEVGLNYLSHLMDSGDFDTAASVCPQVLGNNINLWEQIVHRFAKARKLSFIASVLPRGDFRLPVSCYELVLEEYLKIDHKGFANLLNDWPSELYNIRAITNRVLTFLDRDSHNPVLLAALAKLYAVDNRYDRALGIYLRLQHPETFRLIRTHNLYQALQENVLPLMQFGQQEAVDLLLDNMEYVPIDKVVSELENKPNYLYKYLHSLFLRDSHLGSEYHGLQVRLYAEFDRSRLLPFFRSSNYIPLEEALRICEEREYIDEQVFLLGRMGNASRALALIMDHETDVSRAVAFCKDQNDVQLWNELINKSLHKPEFIRGLLENIGTHVDPIILIRRIPNDMNIPGLRDALVKILQDYSMQTALWWECKRILSSDVLALRRKQLKINMRPQRIDEDRLCDACGRLLLCNTGGTRLEFPVIVSFQCQHAFHNDCLPSNNRKTCSACRGKIRHC